MKDIHKEQIMNVIRRQPHAVSDAREGEPGAINFLVGMALQETRGTVDPMDAKEFIEEQI